MIARMQKKKKKDIKKWFIWHVKNIGQIDFWQANELRVNRMRYNSTTTSKNYRKIRVQKY